MQFLPALPRCWKPERASTLIGASSLPTVPLRERQHHRHHEVRILAWMTLVLWTCPWNRDFGFSRCGFAAGGFSFRQVAPTASDLASSLPQTIFTRSRCKSASIPSCPSLVLTRTAAALHFLQYSRDTRYIEERATLTPKTAIQSINSNPNSDGHDLNPSVLYNHQNKQSTFERLRFEP